MGSNGIDVSNNNGRLDLTKGFSGLDFVFAKASEGVGFEDNTLSWYHSQARAAGAVFGAYHFGHPEQHAGASESFKFMAALESQIGGMRSGMPVWYDYEAPAAGWQTRPSDDIKVITDFVGHIRAGHPHAVVGIYSNLDGFGRILPIFPAHLRTTTPLWLAEPNGQLETPDAPLAEYQSAWSVHQYETFAGIDRDYSRWTKQEMPQAFAWH